MVASARSSNEDLGTLVALVEKLGGGEIVYRSARAEDEVPLPGFPTLTRRRDLEPNVKGAELLGLTRVGGDDGTGGLEVVAGHTGTILVVGDELADQDESFGSQASLYVFFGTHAPATSANAHYVLPMTSFAEQEGTFTNVQGRVQRFWPALEAPGSALPAWFALGALLAELTGTEAPRQASQVFVALAEGVPAYADMDYETIGTRGALLREPALISGDI